MTNREEAHKALDALLDEMDELKAENERLRKLIPEKKVLFRVVCTDNNLAEDELEKGKVYDVEHVIREDKKVFYVLHGVWNSSMRDRSWSATRFERLLDSQYDK